MSGANTELADAVRQWVHFDNVGEHLNKQITNVRQLRSTYESKIIDILTRNNMRGATLKVSGASLQCSTRFKQADLSWSLLEGQLHEYFKTQGKRDETADIIGFLQKNRGGKSVEYLKKTLNSPTNTVVSAAQPALPTGTPAAALPLR
jgi:hypothetical protein